MFKGPLKLNILAVYVGGLLIALLSTGCLVKALPDGLGAVGASGDLVLPGLAFSIEPKTIRMNIGQTYTFTASKGVSPYTYSSSGVGTVNTITGQYDSGLVLGSATVTATDAIGQTSTATIEVGVGPSFAVSPIYVEATTLRALTATSASPPLTWEIATGAGVITSTGPLTADFTAGATDEAVTIRVTDANGFYTDLTANVFIRNIVRAPAFALSGAMTTCVVKGSTKEVYCFGSNVFGQLLNGNGLVGDEPSDMGNNLRPMRLGTGRTPTQISIFGGDSTTTPVTCALLDDGNAKCWGHSSYTFGHNMGYTDSNAKRVNTLGDDLLNVPLGIGRTAKSIHSSMFRSACAIMDDDNVKCWGAGSSGFNGQDNLNVIGDAVGELAATPAINLGAGAISLATSAGSVCAVLVGGTVKCWGLNNYGQLGQGGVDSRGDAGGEMAALAAIPLTATVNKVYGLNLHFCARTTTNGLRCWGANTNGQLGIGSVAHQGDGAGEIAALTDISLGTGFAVADACAGFAHTCALSTTGVVKCFGYNTDGQLGIGSTTQIGDAAIEMGDNLAAVNLGTGLTATQLACGSNHTCTVLNNGSLKCWGSNNKGQLGLGHLNNQGDGPGEMGDNLSAINVGTGVTVLDVTAGGESTCIRVNTGTTIEARCWGSNTYGQLGTEFGAVGDEPGEMGSALSPLSLGTGLTVADIKMGYARVCALFTNNSAKCWGHNGQRALGTALVTGDIVGEKYNETGDNLAAVVPLGGRTVTGIYPGRYEYTSCITYDNNDLICWGQGNLGRLGYDGTGHLATLIANPAVNVGGGVHAIKVDSDYNHRCALLSDGTIKCWGEGVYGKLGYGNVDNQGDGVGEMALLPTVDLGLGRTAVDVCTGAHNTCALLDNATVKCWGYATYGVLLQGNSTAHLGDDPGEMGNSLPALNFGTGRTVKKLSCGYTHACAILDNDKIKCWGRNANGTIGIGNTSNSGMGDSGGEFGDAVPYVDLGTGRTALEVDVGANNTCVVLDNNEVKCWGLNSAGQLGQGHNRTIGDEPLEMGDNLPAISIP